MAEVLGFFLCCQLLTRFTSTIFTDPIMSVWPCGFFSHKYICAHSVCQTNTDQQIQKRFEFVVAVDGDDNNTVMITVITVERLKNLSVLPKTGYF